MSFRNFAKATESTIQLQEKSTLKLIEKKFLRETVGVKITEWQDFLSIISLHSNINECNTADNMSLDYRIILKLILQLLLLDST